MEGNFFISRPSGQGIACDSLGSAYRDFKRLSSEHIGQYGIWEELIDGEFQAEYQLFGMTRYDNGNLGLSFLAQREEFTDTVRALDVDFYLIDLCAKANRETAKITVCKSADSLLYQSYPDGLFINFLDADGSAVLDIDLFWSVMHYDKQICLSFPYIPAKRVRGIHPTCIVPSIDEALFVLDTIKKITGISPEFYSYLG